MVIFKFISFFSIRFLALFLSAIFLLEGCTVYRSTNIKIQEAANLDTKMKVIMKKGNIYKFKWIKKVDSNYIGYLKKDDNRLKRLPEKESISYKIKNFRGVKIAKDSILEIHPKNKPVSTLVNIGISLIALVQLAVIIVLAIFVGNFSD